MLVDENQITFVIIIKYQAVHRLMFQVSWLSQQEKETMRYATVAKGDKELGGYSNTNQYGMTEERYSDLFTFLKKKDAPIFEPDLTSSSNLAGICCLMSNTYQNK